MTTFAARWVKLKISYKKSYEVRNLLSLKDPPVTLNAELHVLGFKTVDFAWPAPVTKAHTRTISKLRIC